jgi:hypothetical protein
MRRQSTWSVAITALCLIVAAPATAGELGVQSDNVIVDGTPQQRALAFARADQLGATWIRVMIRDDKLGTPGLTAAITGAHAQGFQVIGTLMRWRGLKGGERPGATPAQWANLTRAAVARYGPYVDAWSTGNEPNHPAFAPRRSHRCHLNRETVNAPRVVIRHGQIIVRSWQRVRRGDGSHRRVTRYRKTTRKMGTHRRVVRRKRSGRRVVGYRKARRGRYVRVRSYRRAKTRRARRRANFNRVVTRSPVQRRDRVRVSELRVERACVAQGRGVAFRPVHDAAARQIRAGDPSALVIVGDLAPSTGNTLFMEAMFAAAPGPVDADVVGAHPYWNAHPHERREYDSWQLGNIERLVADVRSWHRHGKLTGGVVWATEWGIQRADPGRWAALGVDRMYRAGVGVVVYYELVAHPPWQYRWDTALISYDGTPRRRFYELLP